jgi:undecaprenyl-diphosphatase
MPLFGADHPVRQKIADFDDAVDTAFDRLRGHPTADRVFYAASELGDFALIWHIVAAAQALRPSRPASSAVRVSALLGAESLLVNGAIKSLFRRRRPIYDAVIPRPHRLRQPRTSSFPSGHASSAFTAAGILSKDDPLWPLYYAIALVVASSRVYVKIHHASDVVAGAALGIVLARAVRTVWPEPQT